MATFGLGGGYKSLIYNPLGISVSPSATPTTVYTCPAGVVAVAFPKDSTQTLPNAQTTLYVIRTPGANPNFLGQTNALGETLIGNVRIDNSTNQLSGAGGILLFPGQELAIFNFSGTHQFWFAVLEY